MSGVETIIALGIAATALYGLGIPLALLLPAPAGSAWVMRIAIGPLYAIVFATTGAWALRTMGVPLHPGHLVGSIVLAWAAALRWGKPLPRVRVSPLEWGWPAALVVTSLVSWFCSLVGYGLYLPNRDFKNHAYWVAQVSFWGTSDPARVLSESPVSGPEPTLFYPLGLHTLLGWALPTSSWNAVGVTAAAAVLVSAISMPLAMIALARLWDAQSRELWVVSGLAAVTLPGFAAGFEIGSVVLIVGAGLYAAVLAALWAALREPSPGAVLALGIGAVGLFELHVAEALGIALVALVAIPAFRPWRRIELSWRLGAAVLVTLVLAALPLLDSISRLQGRASSDWDIEPNMLNPLIAWMGPLFLQPVGAGVLALLWLCLVLAGVWLTVRERRSAFPLLALAVPLMLALFATGRGIPSQLAGITAPWYGAGGRIATLAAVPLALLGCVPVARMVRAGRHAGLARVLAIGGVGLVVVVSVGQVETRRADLQAALAGAGDSPEIAAEVMAELPPGGTVLNFEGDGTANLFAFARVPILDAFRIDDDAGGSSLADVDRVQDRLLDLDDPVVARRLEELSVHYVAIGVSTRYWNPGVAYDWQMLARQPQLDLAFAGTDLVILRYRGER
ncbi:MAG: DUF6541 family protein [Candidatus Nanopelagicales bacterium]